MSLKAFHVVFIVISTVFGVGMGVWCLREYQARGSGAILALSIASFVMTAGLLGYGAWFLKKHKDMSYL